jgi:hypothetical protein
MPLAESIATLSSYVAHRQAGPWTFLVKISYCEIMIYYAPISRQFKVDSAGSGKVAAPRGPAHQTGAKSDHAA